MRTQKDYKDSKQFAAATWICILIGVFLLAAYTVICALGSTYNEIVGIIFLTVYMAIVVAMTFINRQFSSGRRMRTRENIALSTAMSDLIQRVNIPFIVTDPHGKIVWYNDETASLFSRKKAVYGMNISEFCQIAPEELAKHSPTITEENAEETLLEETQRGNASGIIDISDRKFTAKSYEMLAVGKTYYFSVFTEITELCTLKDKIEATYPSAEIYFIDGGQDIYPYIFVAE